MNWKPLLGAFAIGAVLGVLLSYARFNHQVAVLQTHADSVAIASASRDSALSARVKAADDSLAKLATKRTTVDVATATAGSTADSLAEAARKVATAAEKVPLLEAEIVQLRLETGSLKHALTLSDAMGAVWKDRALAAETDVHTLNQQIQDLNTRIRSLRPPPTLAVTLFKNLGYVAVAIGGYELGRHK